MQLGDHGSVAGRSYGFDDCWLVDMAVVGAGFLGDKAIHYLGPTGAGFYGDFSVVGAATAHEALDDVPPDDDTTRIELEHRGPQDERGACRQPGDRGDDRRGVAGAPVEEVGGRGPDWRGPSCGPPATDANGATKVLGTAYVYDDQAPFETKPAGGAWDDTALNGLEVGVEVVS